MGQQLWGAGGLTLSGLGPPGAKWEPTAGDPATFHFPAMFQCEEPQNKNSNFIYFILWSKVKVDPKCCSL